MLFIDLGLVLVLYFWDGTLLGRAFIRILVFLLKKITLILFRGSLKFKGYFVF